MGEGGIYGCGCKEVLDFLILLIPTLLVSVLFAAASLLLFIFKMFFFLFIIEYIKNIYIIEQIKI